jgi:outer membrane lipoprotein-sorting protein
MKDLWRATALIAGLAAAQASGITPDEIMKNVEHRLADQKTVKARFEEVYVWKLTGEKQTVKGEFLLKGDDRFRITTDDQIVVSDGKTIWTFKKGIQAPFDGRRNRRRETLLRPRIDVGNRRRIHPKDENLRGQGNLDTPKNRTDGDRSKQENLSPVRHPDRRGHGGRHISIENTGRRRSH